MEFLIIVAALAIAGYIGYKYYQARTALGTEPNVFDLVQEVKVDVQAVEANAEVAVEAVKAEVKKSAPKVKKAAKKVAEEVKEVKAKVTKKKPNIKIAK